MEFVYVFSKEELNYIFWFVDVIFIIILILVVLVVRKIVKIVVYNSLKLIDDFNK